MLGPHQNTLLLDALRPPSGMHLEVAIGTTFTLDLTALLTIPVAASLSEDYTADGSHNHDAADLLEQIRRHMAKTVIFCQAGAISVPTAYRAALTFVEQSVAEVQKPAGGLFHPKVWVVRFAGPFRTTHRAIVMSRNLTFDRAWDVMVRLDETDSSAGIPSNPLTQFLRRTRDSAPGALTSQKAHVNSLLTSLQGVRFEVPAPFTAGAFVPLPPPGRTTSRQPFHAQSDAALAVSPFLTDAAVSKLFSGAKGRTTLVSRRASLDAAADAARELTQVMRIKDVVLDAEMSVDPSAIDVPDANSSQGNALRGLHAKFYVQDRAKTATWWLGSANLTGNGFGRNVEMMVQLEGHVRDVGTERLVGDGASSEQLAWLIEPHSLPDAPAPAQDEEGVTEMEALAFDLASREFDLTVTESDGAWRAELVLTPAALDEGVSLSAALLSFLKAERSLDDGTASWDEVSLLQITPFIRLTISKGERSQVALVRARLHGDPEHRVGAVLAHAMTSRGDFMRYLSVLLGLDLGRVPAADAIGGPPVRWTLASGGSERVLENLLTAASRAPERLASLDSTLRRLEKDPRFAEIVPTDFVQLWEAVRPHVRVR